MNDAVSTKTGSRISKNKNKKYFAQFCKRVSAKPSTLDSSPATEVTGDNDIILEGAGLEDLPELKNYQSVLY